MDNTLCNTCYIQVFGPIRERDFMIEAIVDLCKLRVVHPHEHLTIAASSSFMLSTTSLTKYAQSFNTLSIVDPISYVQQRKRAKIFSSLARDAARIIVVYIPGSTAAVELDSFVRNVGRPVTIYSYPRHD